MFLEYFNLELTEKFHGHHFVTTIKKNNRMTQMKTAVNVNTQRVNSAANLVNLV